MPRPVQGAVAVEAAAAATQHANQVAAAAALSPSRRRRVLVAAAATQIADFQRSLQVRPFENPFGVLPKDVHCCAVTWVLCARPPRELARASPAFALDIFGSVVCPWEQRSTCSHSAASRLDLPAVGAAAVRGAVRQSLDRRADGVHQGAGPAASALQVGHRLAVLHAPACSVMLTCEW